MPGIQIGATTGIVEWLIVGFVYGLLNAFVRPFIVMFTGRLLIRTFGLFSDRDQRHPAVAAGMDLRLAGRYGALAALGRVW